MKQWEEALSMREALLNVRQRELEKRPQLIAMKDVSTVDKGTNTVTET